MWHLNPLFPYFLFDLSGVLKFPTIIVLLWISPSMSINIYIMYLRAAML